MNTLLHTMKKKFTASCRCLLPLPPAAAAAFCRCLLPLPPAAAAASCRLRKALFAIIAVASLFLCCTANVFAQTTETVPGKEMNESVVKIEPINVSMQNTTILEQVIIFKMKNEQGLEKEYVTPDERKIIEKKVKEYEKNKKITDRVGKIYCINSKFEVVSVEEIKK